ncbi:hypothetical protein IHE31_02115 (plasmid) [Mycetohabitans rhizoxinica]|uniref:hypothetical protein n=1 Tax=Mycetohabitans rhizoxinica TaxID=412963 RepID=UPI0030CA64C9
MTGVPHVLQNFWLLGSLALQWAHEIMRIPVVFSIDAAHARASIEMCNGLPALGSWCGFG